jgi:hypothetical protein
LKTSTSTGTLLPKPLSEPSQLLSGCENDAALFAVIYIQIANWKFNLRRNGIVYRQSVWLNEAQDMPDQMNSQPCGVNI